VENEYKTNPVSQTGATTAPIQVENVQYDVTAEKYTSKPALIFTIANSCFAIGLFLLASLLFNVTGVLLGFAEETHMQFFISALIPLGVVGVIALMRLEKLLRDYPAAIEDIKFKSRLRKSFLTFLTLTCIGSFVAIFNFLGIFTDMNEKAVQNSFFSLYYVGGLVIMTLGLYRYQKMTSR
jgi:hypothetical protein